MLRPLTTYLSKCTCTGSACRCPECAWFQHSAHHPHASYSQRTCSPLSMGIKYLLKTQVSRQHMQGQGYVHAGALASEPRKPQCSFRHPNLKPHVLALTNLANDNHSRESKVISWSLRTHNDRSKCERNFSIKMIVICCILEPWSTTETALMATCQNLKGSWLTANNLPVQ
jgi:hypothetical protein